MPLTKRASSTADAPGDANANPKKQARDRAEWPDPAAKPLGSRITLGGVTFGRPVHPDRTPAEALAHLRALEAKRPASAPEWREVDEAYLFDEEPPDEDAEAPARSDDDEDEDEDEDEDDRTPYEIWEEEASEHDQNMLGLRSDISGLITLAHGAEDEHALLAGELRQTWEAGGVDGPTFVELVKLVDEMVFVRDNCAALVRAVLRYRCRANSHEGLDCGRLTHVPPLVGREVDREGRIGSMLDLIKLAEVQGNLLAYIGDPWFDATLRAMSRKDFAPATAGPQRERGTFCSKECLYKGPLLAPEEVRTYDKPWGAGFFGKDAHVGEARAAKQRREHARLWAFEGLEATLGALWSPLGRGHSRTHELFSAVYNSTGFEHLNSEHMDLAHPHTADYALGVSVRGETRVAFEKVDDDNDKWWISVHVPLRTPARVSTAGALGWRLARRYIFVPLAVIAALRRATEAGIGTIVAVRDHKTMLHSRGELGELDLTLLVHELAATGIMKTRREAADAKRAAAPCIPRVIAEHKAVTAVQRQLQHALMPMASAYMAETHRAMREGTPMRADPDKQEMVDAVFYAIAQVAATVDKELWKTELAKARATLAE